MHTRSLTAVVVAAAGLAMAAPAGAQQYGGGGWGQAQYDQQHQQRFGQEYGPRYGDRYGEQFNRHSEFDSGQWRPVNYLPQFEGLSVTLAQRDDETQTFVRIVDGDVHAYLDGQQVPTRNIQKRGNAIRIVDREGYTAATFTLPQPPQGFGRTAMGAPSRFDDRTWQGSPQQTWRDSRRDVWSRDTWERDTWQQDQGMRDPWMRDPWQTTQRPQSPQRLLGSPDLPVANLHTPAIGILMLNATSQDLQGTNYSRGVLIDATHDGMPADKAGLKQGDIIVKVDGREDITPDQLRHMLGQKSPGDSLRVTYVRDGRERTANLNTTSMMPVKVNWDYMVTGLDQQQLQRQQSQMLRERQDRRQARGGDFFDLGRLFGIRLTDADDEDIGTIEEYHDGLLVTQVTRGSKLDDAGVRRGDKILAVDGRPIDSCDELKDSIQSKSAGDTVRLKVLRDGRERNLTMPLRE